MPAADGDAVPDQAPSAVLDRPPAATGVIERLNELARFEDPSAGRAEEQAFIQTPAGPVFTTLVEPTGSRHDVGFLLCHSFAYEQLDLGALEMTFARLAAARGFPVLAFHARGYGDTGGEFRAATPASQLEDALAAAGHLRRRVGVEAVVPVGARWGAAIALALTRRIDAPGVVLWNPALEPGAYLDELLKVFSRSRIAGRGSPGRSGGPSHEGLQTSLASGADVDLFGYPLASACYREASATHPLRSDEPMSAAALVLVVNPRTEGQARDAGERLRALGSDVRVEQAEGPGRAQFGIGASPAGRRAIAAQPLFEDVARRTVAWAIETWPATRAVGRPASLPPGSDRGEVPVYVPSRGERLGGILSVPEDPSASIGVLLLASRARDRAHRNGLWVKTARSLAEGGRYVLRFDYPGVGTSTGTPRLFGIEDMPSWAVDDACRFLLERTPVRRILLAGTCYGGRVVLDAAARIPQVEGVAVVVAPVLLPPTSRGRVRLQAERLLGRRATAMPERAIDPAFAAALDRFLRRGRAYFLVGDEDPYGAELRIALERLRPPSDRYEVDVVRGEIDSFRSVAMQELTRRRVADWCLRFPTEAIA